MTNWLTQEIGVCEKCGSDHIARLTFQKVKKVFKQCMKCHHTTELTSKDTGGKPKKGVGNASDTRK